MNYDKVRESLRCDQGIRYNLPEIQHKMGIDLFLYRPRMGKLGPGKTRSLKVFNGLITLCATKCLQTISCYQNNM